MLIKVSNRRSADLDRSWRYGRLRKLVTGIQPRIFLSNRHSPVGILRPIRAPVGSSFLWTLSSRTYRKNLFVYLATRMSYPWASTRISSHACITCAQRFEIFFLLPIFTLEIIPNTNLDADFLTQRLDERRQSVTQRRCAFEGFKFA